MKYFVIPLDGKRRRLFFYFCPGVNFVQDFTQKNLLSLCAANSQHILHLQNVNSSFPSFRVGFPQKSCHKLMLWWTSLKARSNWRKCKAYSLNSSWVFLPFWGWNCPFSFLLSFFSLHNRWSPSAVTFFPCHPPLQTETNPVRLPLQLLAEPHVSRLGFSGPNADAETQAGPWDVPAY